VVLEKEKKHHLTHILILLSIALGIGVYLISATVLIAKDGVFYIQQAQRFSSDPLGVMREHPFGYPFLIFAAHKFTCFFGECPSVYGWIYPAQSANLLCRILALIPLYFIGKTLVGGRNSFWSLLILILLPYPAEFGSDALRDWPYIFFLAGGFWAILKAARDRCWWIFGLVGLSSGLGYMIRPECAQLIVYGIMWLTYCFLRPAKTLSRSRIVPAIVLLIGGFLIPVGPYAIVKGKILPEKLRGVVRALSSNTGADKAATTDIHSHKTPAKYTKSTDNRLLDAAGNLVEKAGANLMWFFAAPLIVGIYHHFRKVAAFEEKFLITALIVLNISFLLLRYCCVSPDLTHRYILPLTVMTVFYIPAGLNLLGRLVVKTTAIQPGKTQKVFYTLLIIGICVCLPKLLRPIRIDKQGYLLAANWLRANTSREDIIAAPDSRLYFYAERHGIIYESGKTAQNTKYLVKIINSEDEQPQLGTAAEKVYSVWVDGRTKSKKLVIYKMVQ
jgi:hypothetical protein